MSKIIKKLKKQYNIQHSDPIKELFQNIKTYEYLEEFAQIVKNMGEKVTMVSVPQSGSIHHFKSEIKLGLNVYQHTENTPILYISHQFPKEYKEKCKYGEDFLDCYFFFFTKHNVAQESEKYITYYLNRINKLKVFL